MKELSEIFNKTFTRISNQFTGLYVYDEFHEGHWLEDESKTIEYYNINHMDIIELKEKRVYKMSFENSQESSLIVCSGETYVKDLIKMIICCISSPVDDPTTVGLSFVKYSTSGGSNSLSASGNNTLPNNNNSQTSNASPSASSTWLDPEQLFSTYQLAVQDTIYCFSRYLDNSSPLIASLVITSDPASSATLVCPIFLLSLLLDYFYLDIFLFFSHNFFPVSHTLHKYIIFI